MKNKPNSCSGEFDLMLTFLRISLTDASPDIKDWVDVDWDLLMNISLEHGVLALVWDGICKLPKVQQPARPQLINWGLSAQEICIGVDKKKQVVADLVARCDENNIKVLLFKGMSLSEMYPNPNSRSFSDIDIFLYEDYSKGNQVLAHNNYEFGGRHSIFSFEGITVENHLTLVHTISRIQKRVEAYLEDHLSESHRSDCGYYVMEPKSYLLFLLMHSLSHFDSKDVLTVRHIVDFYMLLSHYRTELRPDDCFQLMNQMKLTRSFELMICLVEWVMNVDMHEYRRCLISQSDVLKAEYLIIERVSLPNFAAEKSFSRRLVMRFRRFQQFRWFYRYSPRKLSDRFVLCIRQESVWLLNPILRRTNLKSANSIKERLSR